jgi:hypothetical protein
LPDPEECCLALFRIQSGVLHIELGRAATEHHPHDVEAAGLIERGMNNNRHSTSRSGTEARSLPPGLRSCVVIVAQWIVVAGHAKVAA